MINGMSFTLYKHCVLSKEFETEVGIFKYQFYQEIYKTQYIKYIIIK